MSNGEIPTAPRPSIGRIVIYRTSAGEDEPAIVRNVDGFVVDLYSFNGNGRIDSVPHSVAADEPGLGTWRWPERA